MTALTREVRLKVASENKKRLPTENGITAPADLGDTMCIIDDAEPFTFSATETRKARRQYRCAECRRIIHVNETYERTRGLVDAELWLDYKTCAHCIAAGSWIRAACGGYPLTMLAEELIEHRDEYPTSRFLAGLCQQLAAQWDNGTVPIPDAADLTADARQCLTELTTHV
jgi:hypothetical protein